MPYHEDLRLLFSQDLTAEWESKEKTFLSYTKVCEDGSDPFLDLLRFRLSERV